MVDANSDPAPLQPGVRIANRYEILGSIGTGGFGRVYRARDFEIGEVVALKFLAPSAETADQVGRHLLHEVRMARRISHPNVIRLHDIGESDGRRFISMELVEGESLSSVIEHRGVIPVGQAIGIFRQMADGVGAAHRNGVVHRDLKPGNVLIERGGQVKVLDFGVAAIVGRGRAGGEDTIVGTPQYIPPEQIEGLDSGGRGDIYSLGVILFEMLTGRLPFEGRTARETIVARLRRDPPDPCAVNSSLPRWLGDVVLRCLERDPKERYASIADLVAEIDGRIAAEEERPTATLGLRRGIRGASRARRRVLLGAGPAVLAILGVALAVPAIRQAIAPHAERQAPLFEDGEVRVIVMEFERMTEDPVTRMVASGLSEALRSKVARRQDVRVMDVEGLSGTEAQAVLRSLGVEHLMAGRVGRLGEEVRILVWVTAVPGRERWMTFERSLRWEASWETIDTLAVAITEPYFARLDEEERGS